MKDTTYPKIYHWLVIIPLIIFIVSFFVTGRLQSIHVVFPILSLLSIPGLAVAYIYQNRYISRLYPQKSFKGQRILLIGSFIVPALAVVAGDIYGVISFGESASSTSFVIAGWVFALSFAVVVLWFAALNNMVYIINKGRLKWLDTVAIVGATLLWLLTFFISYYGFMIAYSLRNPSTE